MHSTEPQTADELTRACAGMHLAAIPLFNRAITTPDVEVEKRERARCATAAIRKLTPPERDALIAVIYAECQERLKERESRIANFLKRIFTFCLTPSPCSVRMIGAAYALDLPGIHGDLSMAAMARKMDVTRASISNAAWDFVKQNRLHGIAPSRWMRSLESSKASRRAREKYCQPDTDTPSTTTP